MEENSYNSFNNFKDDFFSTFFALFKIVLGLLVYSLLTQVVTLPLLSFILNAIAVVLLVLLFLDTYNRLLVKMTKNIPVAKDIDWKGRALSYLLFLFIALSVINIISTAFEINVILLAIIEALVSIIIFTKFIFNSTEKTLIIKLIALKLTFILTMFIIGLITVFFFAIAMSMSSDAMFSILALIAFIFMLFAILGAMVCQYTIALRLGINETLLNTGKNEKQTEKMEKQEEPKEEIKENDKIKEDKE